MEKKINQSLSTVRQKLSSLRNKGVVSVVEGGGRGRRNHYTLNVIDTSPVLLSELKSIEKSIVEEKVEIWKKNLGDSTWFHFNERGKIAPLE